MKVLYTYIWYIKKLGPRRRKVKEFILRVHPLKKSLMVSGNLFNYFSATTSVSSAVKTRRDRTVLFNNSPLKLLSDKLEL